MDWHKPLFEKKKMVSRERVECRLKVQSTSSPYHLMKCELERKVFLAFFEQALSCVDREIHHQQRNICRTKPFRHCNRLLTYKPVSKSNKAACVKK